MHLLIKLFRRWQHKRTQGAIPLRPTPSTAAPPPAPPPEPDEPGVIKIKRRSGKSAPLRIEAETLRGVDLHGRDLSEGVFDGLDLSGANLSGCGLMNASFRNATLQDANLSEVITQKAAYVQGASFYGANLANGKITGTNMEYTQFDSANLENADFTGSVLGCTFRSAKLKNANFSGADLTKSTFGRLADPVRYNAATRWPPRFAPSDIGKPAVDGQRLRCRTAFALWP